MAHTTVADLLDQTSNPYTPGRYPYTYACDFIRTNPHVVPAAVRFQVTADDPTMFSRAEASQLIDLWATAEGRTVEDLARTLADAYMRLNGIHATV